MSGECDLCGSYDHVEAGCDRFSGPGPCAACGHDPACGFASVNDDWYCHDDDCDCYSTAGAEAIARAMETVIVSWRPLMRPTLRGWKTR